MFIMHWPGISGLGRGMMSGVQFFDFSHNIFPGLMVYAYLRSKQTSVINFITEIMSKFLSFTQTRQTNCLCCLRGLG